MRKFDYTTWNTVKWDSEIISYLTQIHEYKTKQNMYCSQHAVNLQRLIPHALQRSTEASNAIEGIRTTQARLRQLVEQSSAPRSHDEQEILGYRDVLQTINESFDTIPLTPNYILQLHKMLYKYSQNAYGGKFKSTQNYIATTENGVTHVVVTPPAPYETPILTEEICIQYNLTLTQTSIDPLLLIGIYIHDFLCIHPFTDGNGRMSRLLTTLLLYQNGYTVGKYVSIEEKIAERKEEYYRALSQAQTGWDEGKEDKLPFLRFLLSILLSAYRELDETVSITTTNGKALQIVSAAIQTKIGKFTKRDIMTLCPSLSDSSVEASLKTLLTQNVIEKHGGGRSTYYTYNALHKENNKND